MEPMSQTKSRNVPYLICCSTQHSFNVCIAFSFSSSPTQNHTRLFDQLDTLEADVHEVLASLDTHKLPGSDDITPSVLKYCVLAPTTQI